jgi:predicted DCC family thiol-disulfide oxidoreductase YuxK
MPDTAMSDIIVFDGVCHLCSRSTRFILDHESKPVLRFASILSAAGSRLMRELGLDPQDAKTFVLLSADRAHFKSDAAIRVAGYLRWPWRILGVVRVVPRPIRNWVYDRIARNRYRWFGRSDSCMMPTPELRSRFIQE